MTLTLVDEDTYKRLLCIQEAYPKLTFKNKGYEGLAKRTFSTEEQYAFDEVTSILKKAVLGFREFNNFFPRKDGSIDVRIQYEWTADDEQREFCFVGVGYIPLDTLLHGFKEKTVQ